MIKNLFLIAALIALSPLLLPAQTLQNVTDNGNTTHNKIISYNPVGMEVIGTYGSPAYLVIDQTANSGGKRWRFGHTGGAPGFGSFDISNVTDNLIPFSIAANGFTGIGTTTPVSLLELSSGTPKFTLSPVAYSGNYRSSFGTRSGAQAYLTFGNNALNEMRIGNTGVGGYLNIYTNNTKELTDESDGNLAMHFAANGSVGVATTSPSQKLTVNGNLNVDNATGGNYMGFGIPNHSEYATIGTMYSSGGLVLAHGLKPKTNAAQLIFSHPTMSRNAIVLGDGFTDGGIKFYAKASSTETVGNVLADDPVMQITDGGRVGVGTTNPDEKLAVNGKIHAKEIRVDATGLPDYVFEADYQLPSLAETEAFIKKNKHLPEVPSAANVERNGLELGEMNKILLKKIEELTLHLIEKEKEINQLKATERKTKELEARLARLEGMVERK
ncbi:MAG: hypothetical protein REI78_00385 [Pedobacter sp.]|nr:hypothetical protein [Pedobacter sp.]